MTEELLVTNGRKNATEGDDPTGRQAEGGSNHAAEVHDDR